MSGTISCAGVKNEAATSDIQVESTQNVVIKSPGELQWKNDGGTTKFFLDQNGNLTVKGNLSVEGDITPEVSSEVMLGDSIINLLAGASSSPSLDAGLLITRLTETGTFTVTSFTNSTGVIATSADYSATFTAGKLFAVRGAEDNNGIFKVQSSDANGITIASSANCPGVRTSLTDETVSGTANINKVSPALLRWNESTDAFEVGTFSEDDSGSMSSAAVTYEAPGFTFGESDAEGTGNAIRSGATIQLFDDSPITQNPVGIAAGGSASKGSVNYAARIDHAHSAATGTPVSVGGANADGSSSNFARSDHVHNIDADGGTFKHGIENIGNGAGSVSVTYTTAFGTGTTKVNGTLINTTDGSPTHHTFIITAMDENGFTATLSGTTATGNYKFSWEAYGS